MIDKIDFFIAPSIDHKTHVKYEHPNVKIIDWSSIYSHFFYWSTKCAHHHWLPSEAIRFLQFACIDEHLDLHLNENTTKIFLKADGRTICYFVPNVGKYTVTDYNGNTIEGDSTILYDIEHAASPYHLYVKSHRISTITRTDNPDGPKILMIADSMAIPWVLCLAPICSTITYIDNRFHLNLSKYNLHDYDKCIALMVNHHKIPPPSTAFVTDTVTYFANQIKR